MEDTLQISAIEKDDSFSILCASLEAAKKSTNVDESAYVREMLGKLAEVRFKFDASAGNMAHQVDILEAQHAEEIAAKQAQFEATLKDLQEQVRLTTDQLKKQSEAQGESNQIIQDTFKLMASVRDGIDHFLKSFNQSTTADEQVENQREEVEVVNIESESEDAPSDHEPENDEMDGVQELPQTAEDSDVEVIQNDGETNESEQVEQNLSNGDAHDETVQENGDEGKENVRPQSTPIGKADPPVAALEHLVSAASTQSVINSVPKVPAAPLVEQVAATNVQLGTPGALQGMLYCGFCEETLPDKALFRQHCKNVHAKKRGKKSTDGKFVRNKRKRDDDNDDADEEINDAGTEENGTIPSGLLIAAHTTPVQKALKRIKKINSVFGTDFIIMPRQN